MVMASAGLPPPGALAGALSAADAAAVASRMAFEPAAHGAVGAEQSQYCGAIAYMMSRVA